MGYFSYKEGLNGHRAAAGVQGVHPNKAHAAIFYRPDGKKPLHKMHIFDSGWQNEAISGTAQPYLCAVPESEILQGLYLLQVRGVCHKICEAVKKKKTTIEFGLTLPQGCFQKDEDGDIIFKGDGLTCSALVVAVMDHAGVATIDLATWPELNDTDKEVLKGHLRKEKKEELWDNYKRVTPTQCVAVMHGARGRNNPLSHKVIAEMEKEVIEKLKKV